MSGSSELFLADGEGGNPHTQSMAEVMSETFERMGFMEAFAVDGQDLPDDCLGATLKIDQPLKAAVSFFVPQELAWSIAENLYGAEELSMELVTDMIGELLNTIAGKLLSKVLPDQEFSLTIPQATSLAQAAGPGSFHYYFNIDNQGIAAIVLQP